LTSVRAVVVTGGGDAAELLRGKGPEVASYEEAPYAALMAGADLLMPDRFLQASAITGWCASSAPP
jgi:hypothetical protein